MRLLPAVAAFALAALLAVALAQSKGPRRAAPRVRHALTVSGSMRWLFPGRSTRLPLVVRNNRGFRIRLVSLTVRVRDARPGCGKRYLRVGRLRRKLLVPPHGFRTVDLAITMLRSAPNACQGAVFPLRYTARGRRV
jgi:hypothetical protein